MIFTGTNKINYFHFLDFLCVNNYDYFKKLVAEIVMQNQAVTVTATNFVRN